MTLFVDQIITDFGHDYYCTVVEEIPPRPSWTWMEKSLAESRELSLSLFPTFPTFSPATPHCFSNLLICILTSYDAYSRLNIRRCVPIEHDIFMFP
jgi:hypothetical protein